MTLRGSTERGKVEIGKISWHRKSSDPEGVRIAGGGNSFLQSVSVEDASHGAAGWGDRGRG